jgi:hypothetical protein
VEAILKSENKSPRTVRFDGHLREVGYPLVFRPSGAEWAWVIEAQIGSPPPDIGDTPRTIHIEALRQCR